MPKISELMDAQPLAGNELVEVVQDLQNRKISVQLLKGLDGKSAYELAVQNGYPGTLAAWLLSLKGEPGQDGTGGAAPKSVVYFTTPELDWSTVLEAASPGDYIFDTDSHDVSIVLPPASEGAGNDYEILMEFVVPSAATKPPPSKIPRQLTEYSRTFYPDTYANYIIDANDDRFVYNLLVDYWLLPAPDPAEVQTLRILVKGNTTQIVWPSDFFWDNDNNSPTLGNSLTIVDAIWIDGRWNAKVIYISHGDPAPPEEPIIDQSFWTEMVVPGGGPVARYGHKGAVSLDAGKAFFYGGYRTDVPAGFTNEMWEYGFDNTWAAKNPGPAGRTGHCMVGYGGLIFMFGGQVNGSSVNELWEYLWATDTWVPRATGPSARSWAAAAVHNNKIYLYGGYDSSTEYDDLWEYSIDTDTWTELTVLTVKPGVRYAASLTAINDKLYLFGGQRSNGVHFDEIWIYDTGANTWVEGPASGQGRSNHAATAFGDRLMIFGGNVQGSAFPLNSLTSFHTMTSVWKEEATAPDARSDTALLTYAAQMHMYAGHSNTTDYNDVWVYTYVPTP